jgi:dihydrofolate reductase
MRKLVAQTFMSLDGVMQAPGGPDEDRDGGFQHGGWSAPYFNADERMLKLAGADFARQASGLVLGRRTYEIFAGYWPNQTDPSDEVAKALNTAPKYVASRTLKRVDWNNSSLIEGDVADEVARLKEEGGGELQVHGSGNLLQTLLKHDLVDTLRLWQFPVVLGGGKRLFAEGAIPRRFRLTEQYASPTGAVLQAYERVGELTYGTVGEEPTAVQSSGATR